MPVITVEMWAGRTTEQKGGLAKGITEQFTEIGVPADQVHIIFKDNNKKNWAVAGELCGT